jgi:hypothetical protein
VLRFQRNMKGYGGFGATWSFNPFGRTVLLSFGPWTLTYHWQTQANRRLLDDARRDMWDKTG